MRIWNKITGEPWAITESSLQTILDIAARENESPEAVAAKLGRELRNTQTVIERDGVAIIPVVGPLFRYANIFTQISGASSYEILAKDFNTALQAPEIKAIILDVDSPGGEVNGVSELANMVFEARGKKPIIAYASGDAASGAYWLASAADSIVVSETSSLGSIGVVGVYRKKDAKESASEIEIVSSQSPHKRLDPSSDEGHKRLQSRIDSMADVFITTISRNRSISPQIVLDNFGGGDVFIGANAVAVGMADKIGSLERLISELSSADNPPNTEGIFLNETQNKETPMPKENITIETLKQEQPDLVATIAINAGKTERERIKGIMACTEAEGREELAKGLAFDTEMNVHEAQQMLAVAPKVEPQSTESSFEKAMANTANPDVGADAEEEQQQMDVVIERISKY